MTMLALCCGIAAVSLSSPPRPHIVQIVADDLGYNDLGFLNGGATLTPSIDALVAGGVRLTDYYTFRVCAPSRAATMTGRYPHNVGFYDMSNDGNHCVHPSFKMLPQLLREQGYRTHATGKWDVGYVEQHCTPTFRGFESFLGYYTACTSDYWYHGAPGGNATASKCGGVDFHDSTTGAIAGAPMSGARSVNGTYDRDLFTARATDVIAAHDAAEPLYLYVSARRVLVSSSSPYSLIPPLLFPHSLLSTCCNPGTWPFTTCTTPARPTASRWGCTRPRPRWTATRPRCWTRGRCRRP